MSHLKKFADTLRKAFTPRVHSLVICGTSNDYLVNTPCALCNLESKKTHHHDIPSLLMTAAENELVSLSSPLIGILNSIVLLHKSPVIDQWEEYKNSHQSDYHILINPKVLAYSQESEFREEECPSIPTLYFEVQRSLGVQIEYTTNKGIVTQEEFYGFEARVLLHEIDHLKGIIPSNFSVCKGKSRSKYNFAELDQVENYYNNLVKNELEKLEILYKKDKEFMKKTDFQPDKKDFFMRIALGNERFEEYRAKAADAFRICTNRGKLKKDQPLITDN
ncbi:hypothetical protein SteCoe_28669 [Stentor coeruleus]|uniref:Peptide deformylase n=1 Tax=Stentor coeruleus TaxID=5963 RepID=A0A1R2B831_9CILI|nr:hypothetical protein SteCoe_28669 [Stentor coeruleus]